MNPNANLQEQEGLLRAQENGLRLDAVDRARLRELREALYWWCRDGGFHPDWSKAPRAARYYGREVCQDSGQPTAGSTT